MRPSTPIAFDYASFVADLKTRHRIGTAIRQKQTVQGWGDGVVERLANDLKRAFPGMTGFSAASLWRMRQLHEVYTAPDFLSQLVRETAPRAKAAKDPPATPSAKLAQAVRETVVAIPWLHHVDQLGEIAQPTRRLYRLQATARFGWGRNVLLNQIGATGRPCFYQTPQDDGPVWPKLPGKLPGRVLGYPVTRSTSLHGPAHRPPAQAAPLR